MQKEARLTIETSYGRFYIKKSEWENWSQNYKTIYNKLMDELKNDSRVKYLLFDYDEDLKGNAINIYTQRGTMFTSDIAFEDDHSNDDEVVSRFLDAWSKLPEVESEKEQFEGVWKETGKKIQFNREWSGYRFTDNECIALLNGEHIQFKAKTKKNEVKTFCGILAQQEYNGFKYFGFKLDGYALPDKFSGRKLTEKEKSMLKSGKEVLLTDLWSERRKQIYSAYATYNFKEGLVITRYV